MPTLKEPFKSIAFILQPFLCTYSQFQFLKIYSFHLIIQYIPCKHVICKCSLKRLTLTSLLPRLKPTLEAPYMTLSHIPLLALRRNPNTVFRANHFLLFFSFTTCVSLNMLFSFICF